MHDCQLGIEIRTVMKAGRFPRWPEQKNNPVTLAENAQSFVNALINADLLPARVTVIDSMISYSSLQRGELSGNRSASLCGEIMCRQAAEMIASDCNPSRLDNDPKSRKRICQREAPAVMMARSVGKRLSVTSRVRTRPAFCMAKRCGGVRQTRLFCSFLCRNFRWCDSWRSRSHIKLQKLRVAEGAAFKEDACDPEDRLPLFRH